MRHDSLDLCMTIDRAHANLRLALDDALGKHHGIDFGDFALLEFLARAQDHRARIADLARRLGTSRSTALRRLLALEKIGLLERTGADGIRMAVLRPIGRARAAQAADTAESVCAAAVASIAPAEAVAMKQALSALAR